VGTPLVQISSRSHQLSDMTKALGKQLAPEATLKVTDRCNCHISLNKQKVRACSEDLTRHRNKSARNRVCERLLHSCPRDDTPWCATKRHAIYSDTLVLPLLSPKLDSVGLEKISVAPALRNPQSYTCRRCTKPRYLEDVFGSQGNMTSRILTRSQSEQSFAPRKFSVQNRSSIQPSLYPSVSHLQLSRNIRGSLAFRTIIKSTLNVVHGQPLQHPKIILDLLIELEQVIEEWNSLKGE